MLKRYKVDIHSAEGHDHSKTESTSRSFQQEFSTLAGKYELVKHDIPIPTDAKPAEYHIVVYCTYEAGNQGIGYVYIDIEALTEK